MFRKIITTLSISGLLLGSLSATATAAPVQQASALAACPLLSAHRGAPRVAPENTVPAFAAAGDLGADIFEVDLRFNKSNFAFALHDQTVDRTTNGTGNLSSFWLGDAQALSAADFTNEFGTNWRTSSYAGFNADGSPKVRMPYAWEILSVAKSKNAKLILDLKDPITREQMDFWMSYVDRPEFNYRSKIIWQVGNAALINTMKNTWGYDDMTYHLFQYRPSVDNIWSQAYLDRLDADGVSVPPQNITKEAVTYWHSVGKKVITWTSDYELGYDNPPTWKKLADDGVDIITSNDPAWYSSWCAAGMPVGSKIRPTGLGK